MTPTNPKQMYGDKKPAIGDLPLSGMIEQSLAHMDGKFKYGFRNWLESKVEARTYLNAATRHLQLWGAGEKLARDTKVHNLGGVMACCAILIDAEMHKALIDNRAISKIVCNRLHDAEEAVAFLKAQQAERDRNKQ